ncbi:MAG: DUF5011 domain-containing protein [Lutibacter sp.]|nr:DUF5011 domain-containing protein [Lutibacter sp.]
MKQLLKKVKQILMLLLAISLLGCENNDDDNFPEVIAGFTYTINVDTGTVTFINTSVNSRNYFWTFGDGTSSTEINPIKTFPTGEYKVTLKATNVAGASNTYEDTIVISDAGAPIITLLGDTTMNVAIGATFTDPGATAEDDLDGDITANIVVGGDVVDVNTAGTYIITYNVSDAAGNAATQRTRTVIVAAAAPTCPETLLALPINFDCDGIDYESKRVAGGIDFSIIDNPQLNGVNATASKVGEIVNKGDNWENLNFKLDTPINFTTNKSIKVKLYSKVSVPIKLKVETGGTPVENDQTHGGTGWEELTFTLATSESYSNIIVFIDGPGNTAGTFYIDDIEQVAGGDNGSGTAPTAAAPVPTQDAANVISVYSDTYDDIAGTNFNPNWGQATVQSEVTVSGNKTLLYTGLNYQGTQLGSPANVSSMEYLHIDFWTANATALDVFLISTGPVEKAKALTVPTGGVWTSIDISLTDFSPVNLADIIQFKFAGNGDIYLDNIYFYGTGNGTACTETTLVLPIDFDCESIDYESKRFAGGIDFSIIDNPQLNGVNATASKVGEIVNKGDNWENLNFKLDTPINFTTNKSIKVKLYSKVSVPIKLKVETGGTPVENDQTHGGTGWEELTFTLATSESFSNIIVFIDGPGNTAGTFYIDDIEQVSNGGGGGTVGDCPAPPAGELLSNGDFEAGESCWQFFAGSSLSTTVNNGGSKSAQLQGSTGVAVGLKQERFAAGILLPNTQYTVTFDIIASGPFGEGGVFKTFTFSESAEGSNLGAIQHILADGVTSLPTTWTPQSFTFTSSADPNFVAGGLSFLIEIVNSSVKLNVDNVVIKKTP